MASRVLLPLIALLLTTSAARADIPAGFEEPDEDQAKQTAAAWLAAAKAGDVNALTELGLFGYLGMKVTYTQRTAPADAKARKRCGKIATVTTDKAMKKALPCLLTPDIKAALATVDIDAAGSFAATYDDIVMTSPELTKAKRPLKKLDETHVYWTFIGMRDGVAHGFVLAISTEFASGAPRVGAVIHGAE